MAEGAATNIQFEKMSEEEIIINFDYGDCKTKYHFRHNPQRPRKIEFTFNGEKFTREIGEGYKQSFKSDSKIIEIEDPLRVSIEEFVNSVNEGGMPLILMDDILISAKLTDYIISEYDKT